MNSLGCYERYHTSSLICTISFYYYKDDRKAFSTSSSTVCTVSSYQQLDTSTLWGELT